MSFSDIHFLSATEQQALILSGQISSLELTNIYLERIKKFDPTLGAYLTITADLACQQAKEIDQRIANKQPVGPLAGLPIAIKDNIVTKDIPTTAASICLKNWVPPYDATIVSKLHQAGAVLLGKLNCDEFGMGSTTENSALRHCLNPWNIHHVPGGSSGGSAAAVAAGLCSAAIGTDTGGSIRQPAAFCGIVGIKPTYGLVSRLGVIAFASSFDQVGPMTRTVADAALFLNVLAGHDPNDSTSLPDASFSYTKSLSQESLAGKTIGIPREYFNNTIDPDIQQATDQAIEVFKEQGATFKTISLQHHTFNIATYSLLSSVEASSNLLRYDGIHYGFRHNDTESLSTLYTNSRNDGFGDEVKRRIMLGTFALYSEHFDAYYDKARRARTLIRKDFESAFESIDFILSPTTPHSAFTIKEEATDMLSMYLGDIFLSDANLSGFPAISIPCGMTRNKLPIGLQLMAPWKQEASLLQAGHLYEQCSALDPKHPDLTNITNENTAKDRSRGANYHV